ncbi:MAG TPA: hypothetical protein VH107_06660, partial [Lacipirellulaceae bacterium]|nr:hypothetical protein [Lacipirellulaceae bacterium]
SPIRVGNRIFGFSRSGDVTVLAADKQYQLLAHNELGELCEATPAIANGRMYVRTDSTLLCIGQPPSN